MAEPMACFTSFKSRALPSSILDNNIIYSAVDSKKKGSKLAKTMGLAWCIISRQAADLAAPALWSGRTQ